MIIKFCLYGFIKDLRFFEPFFIPYLLSSGISISETGILISIRWAIVFLLEIPTGIIADFIGKKGSMITCFLSYLTSFFIIGYYPFFYSLILGMIFYGIGEAFRTGTHKAIILDFLEKNNRLNEKTKVYSLTRSFSMLGSSISALTGMGLIFYTGSLEKIFHYSLIPYFAGLILILSYPPDEKKEQNQDSIKKHLSLLKDQLKTPQIRSMLTLNSLLEASFKLSKEFIQPIILTSTSSLFFLQKFSSTQSNGIVLGTAYFIFYILSSIASANANKSLKLFKNEKNGERIIYWIFTISLLFIPLSANFGPTGIILLCGIIFFIFNIRKPLVVSTYGEIVHKKHRAGILSIDSQLQGLWAMFLSLLLGYGFEFFGNKGFYILPLSLILIRILLNYSNKK